MSQFFAAAGVATIVGAAIKKGIDLHPLHLLMSLAVILSAYMFAVHGQAAVAQKGEELSRLLRDRKVLVAGAVAGLFLGSLLARLTQTD
jgi:uncharacterized membrane protein YfcA